MRGQLVEIDGLSPPFQPRRMFLIRDVPVGTVRGGHAHRARTRKANGKPARNHVLDRTVITSRRAHGGVTRDRGYRLREKVSGRRQIGGEGAIGPTVPKGEAEGRLRRLSRQPVCSAPLVSRVLDLWAAAPGPVASTPWRLAMPSNLTRSQGSAWANSANPTIDRAAK